jgi:superfamily II DNA or RNA helicase
MALEKKKLTLKIKDNEIVNLVEQEDNHLELVINDYIDKNISLPDIITDEEAQNDEDLQNKIFDIYFKLVKERIKNKTILNYVEDIKSEEESENLPELIDSDVETEDNEEDNTDEDIDEVDTDDDEPIINNDEANIKRSEVQKLYINDAYTELQINNRVMIVGPTGFGKTVVNYMLIDKLKPKITFIFTPRQNLNKQTLDIKYIKYLKTTNYVFYNYSPEKQYSKHKFADLINFVNKNKKLNKNIIVLLCYQSCKTLIPKLIKSKFKINLAICDEAHTRSSWALLSKVYHKLFLELNNKLIEKYIFATATPKSDMKISPYNTLFGKVIEHVQIYELIQWGILCDFETIVKNIDFDKKKLDLSNFIIETMIKYKRQKGVIYVNSQKNAMELYAYIKFKYPNYNTFIYISEKLSQDSFKDFKYNINFNKDDTNLECFERCIKPCIIITCNKISYGYDNVFIDLICFADPRQSEEENRQITGRGLRNDVSKYLDKFLLIMLLTSELHLLDKHQSNDEGTISIKDNIYIEYKNIKAFLEFIIGACGKDIVDGRICSTINRDKPSCISPTNAKDYSGDIIPSEIIKELSTTFYRKYEKFLGFLRNHNVYNEETYNLIRERPENIEWMPLLGNIRTTFKKFCFLDIKSPENNNYYQTLEECNKAYEEALKKIVIDSNGNYKSISDLKKRKTDNQINKKIVEIDTKIPINIKLFYNSIDDNE